MRKEEYIQEVISRIENKKARREVEKELSAHIDDRISYYTDAGWDEETASEKALEHMGEAKSVALKMGFIHNSRKRYCFYILLAIILVHILTEILVFAFNGKIYYLGNAQYFEDYIFLTDMFCLIFALIFIVISYLKNGTFLTVAIAFETYGLITGMFDDGVTLQSLFFNTIWHSTTDGVFPFELVHGGFIFRSLLYAALIPLTLIACRSAKEKEQKESKFLRAYSVVAYSVLVFVIMIFIEIIYAFLLIITGTMYSLTY